MVALDPVRKRRSKQHEENAEKNTCRAPALDGNNPFYTNRRPTTRRRWPCRRCAASWPCCTASKSGRRSGRGAPSTRPSTRRRSVVYYSRLLSFGFVLVNLTLKVLEATHRRRKKTVCANSGRWNDACTCFPPQYIDRGRSTSVGATTTVGALSRRSCPLYPHQECLLSGIVLFAVRLGGGTGHAGGRAP